jgi:hypothetical protein
MGLGGAVEEEEKMMSEMRQRMEAEREALLQAILDSSRTRGNNNVIGALSNTATHTLMATTQTAVLPSLVEYNALVDLYNSTNGNNWTNTLANNRRWNIRLVLA